MLASGINGSTNNISEKSLRVIRQEKLNRIIIAHLNINSIRNKFDLLPNQIIGNVDVLVISETKVNSSCSIGQFKIRVFSTPFRRDSNSYGGDFHVFVRRYIS